MDKRSEQSGNVAAVPDLEVTDTSSRSKNSNKILKSTINEQPMDLKMESDLKMQSDSIMESDSDSTLPSVRLALLQLSSPDRKRRDVTLRSNPLDSESSISLPKLRGRSQSKQTPSQEDQTPSDHEDPETSPKPSDYEEQTDRGEDLRGRSRIKNRILTNDIPGNPHNISLMGFETIKSKLDRTKEALPTLGSKPSRLYLKRFDDKGS